MIGLPPGVRVLVATKPVDFRKGADTLAALAKEALKQDPYAGTVLVFRAKRANQPTFCIRSALREDRLSLASALRPNAARLTEPAWSGVQVYLHRGTPRSLSRAAVLDV